MKTLISHCKTLIKFHFAMLTLLTASHVVNAAESYEPNNTLQDAHPILVNDREKVYSFEYGGDEDWFVFNAKKGTPYDIEFLKDSVGQNVDLAVQIFNVDGEEETGLFDFGFAGERELVSLPSLPNDGLYYIKVINKESQFGIDNHYALKVFIPFGPDNLLLKGAVTDSCTNNGIRNASVSVSLIENNVASIYDEKPTFANGAYSFPLRPGSYSVTVNADGYKSQKQDFSRENIPIDEVVRTDLAFSMQPTNGCGSIPIQVANPADAVAIYNDQTGQLTINDVRIGGGQILAAELQGVGPGQFKLTRTTDLAKPVSLIPAFFNFDTNLADIGRVYAFQQLYAVQLQNIGNNIFVINGTPRVVNVK